MVMREEYSSEKFSKKGKNVKPMSYPLGFGGENCSQQRREKWRIELHKLMGD